MRKFQYISMILFIQMTMLVTGFIEVSEGHFLYSAYKNTLLGERIIAVGNSFEDIYVNMNNLQKDKLLATQDIKFYVPTITLNPLGTSSKEVTVLRNLPDFGVVIGIISSMLNLFFNICILILAVFVQLIVGSYFFYQMIILALLPQGTKTVMYAAIFAGIFALLQTFVVVVDLVKSVKGFGIASFNALFDLEGGGGGGSSRRGANKRLTDFM